MDDDEAADALVSLSQRVECVNDVESTPLQAAQRSHDDDIDVSADADPSTSWPSTGPGRDVDHEQYQHDTTSKTLPTSEAQRRRETERRRRLAAGLQPASPDGEVYIRAADGTFRLLRDREVNAEVKARSHSLHPDNCVSRQHRSSNRTPTKRRHGRRSSCSSSSSTSSSGSSREGDSYRWDREGHSHRMRAHRKRRHYRSVDGEPRRMSRTFEVPRQGAAASAGGGETARVVSGNFVSDPVVAQLSVPTGGSTLRELGSANTNSV